MRETLQQKIVITNCTVFHLCPRNFAGTLDSYINTRRTQKSISHITSMKVIPFYYQMATNSAALMRFNGNCSFWLHLHRNSHVNVKNWSFRIARQFWKDSLGPGHVRLLFEPNINKIDFKRSNIIYLPADTIRIWGFVRSPYD